MVLVRAAIVVGGAVTARNCLEAARNLEGEVRSVVLLLAQAMSWSAGPKPPGLVRKEVGLASSAKKVEREGKESTAWKVFLRLVN